MDSILRIAYTIFRVVGGILVGIGVASIFVVTLLLSGGISARQAPGTAETELATKLRSMAIPREARDLKSPVPASDDAVREGMEHFADHCAVCHGNDGSGNTRMGQNMNPRVPDMRKAPTQDLTDGELYYIIDNGVRMTGMPGWGGDPEHGPEANWNLIQFIRHLPKLTPAEEERMRTLNPKAPDEDHEGHEGHEGHERHEGHEGAGHEGGAAPSHKHGG